MEFLYVGLGLVILLLAGDSLVRGAVNMSLRLGVPALIVSLTVVAFGTSAPELLISVQAILEGIPGLALGNVVGSNTANILLVLGVPAMIAPIASRDCDTRHSYVQMIGASFLFIGLCLYGVLSVLSGLVLLSALALMLLHAYRSARRSQAGDANDLEDLEGADPSLGWGKISLFLVLGLIGLPLGANLLIEGATEIAIEFGISDAAIGLTLVAIGTSLPELATAVMATIRRQADVILGNVIGSNMFNLLAIMGASALVGDIPVGARFVELDLWMMLAASLMIIPFVFMAKNITRLWGISLTALYIGYIAFAL